jgi:hypothetical protein
MDFILMIDVLVMYQNLIGKKWDDYDCGSWSTDIEMIDQWIVDTDQPYDTLWSETDDGIYLVDKQWSKKL